MRWNELKDSTSSPPAKHHQLHNKDSDYCDGKDRLIGIENVRYNGNNGKNKLNGQMVMTFCRSDRLQWQYCSLAVVKIKLGARWSRYLPLNAVPVTPSSKTFEWTRQNPSCSGRTSNSTGDDVRCTKKDGDCGRLNVVAFSGGIEAAPGRRRVIPLVRRSIYD